MTHCDECGRELEQGLCLVCDYELELPTLDELDVLLLTCDVDALCANAHG